MGIPEISRVTWQVCMGCSQADKPALVQMMTRYGMGKKDSVYYISDDDIIQ